MERSTIFNGKTHYKWQFSIALLNCRGIMDVVKNKTKPCIGLPEEYSGIFFGIRWEALIQWEFQDHKREVLYYMLIYVVYLPYILREIFPEL